MKLKTKFALAAVLTGAALLAGCAQPAVQTIPTENSSINYEVLFTRNGCEVGRFIDYGRPVYVTTCPGGTSASQSSHTESCGKNCTSTHDTYQVQTRGSETAAPSYAVPSGPR
jgi:hypothetical protein